MLNAYSAVRDGGRVRVLLASPKHELMFSGLTWS